MNTQTQRATIGSMSDRRRKLILALPFFISPLLLCAFFALGGGSATPSSPCSDPFAFNTSLPAAHFKKTPDMTKRNYYQQADNDSARFSAWLRLDPYRNKPAVQNVDTMSHHPLRRLAAITPNLIDRQADSLLQRLQTLSTTLRHSAIPAAPSTFAPTSSFTTKAFAPSRSGFIPPTPSPTLANLTTTPTFREAAIPTAIAPPFKEAGIPDDIIPSPKEQDPQLDELNRMLDKLLQVQQNANSQNLPSPKIKDSDNIIGTEALSPADRPQPNSIPAVILSDQTLVPGALLGIRTTRAASVGGVFVPQNQLLYAIVSINNNRMIAHITSFRNQQSIFSTTLQVYDMDGLPGIAIPDRLSRQVARQSADQTINEINPASYDPSIGAQLAGAGVQAAKSLFSHKIRQTRVFVRGGYQVLLRNSSDQDRKSSITIYPDTIQHSRPVPAPIARSFPIPVSPSNQTIQTNPSSRTIPAVSFNQTITPSAFSKTIPAGPFNQAVPAKPTNAGTPDSLFCLPDSTGYSRPIRPTAIATPFIPTPANKHISLHRSVKEGKISFLLTGIDLDSSITWFHLFLRNQSDFAFTPDYLRCYLRDKKATRRMAIQDSPLIPSYNSLPPSIDKHAETDWWIGIPGFAPQSDRSLIFELAGKETAKILCLSMSPGKLAAIQEATHHL